MKRKIFIKAIMATSVLTVVDPLRLLESLEPEKDITLPFVDGHRTVTLLKPKSEWVSKLNAQYYYGSYYNSYSYSNLANYQYWYNYQQAVSYYQQSMARWQQQYYTWMQQSHVQQMQRLLQQYRSYQQIGQPDVWPAVKSIYAYAKDYSGPTLFGLNKYKQAVATKDNLQGAAKIFDAINNHYGQREAERTVGPQSDEKLARITLPNGQYKNGKYYDTDNGFLAVSNPDELVRADNGKVGRLAKYVTGDDGQQYAVV